MENIYNKITGKCLNSSKPFILLIRWKILRRIVDPEDILNKVKGRDTNVRSR